jgi:hypothetical protein
VEEMMLMNMTVEEIDMIDRTDLTTTKMQQIIHKFVQTNVNQIRGGTPAFKSALKIWKVEIIYFG